MAAAPQGLAEGRAVLPGLTEATVVCEQLAKHVDDF